MPILSTRTLTRTLSALLLAAGVLYLGDAAIFCMRGAQLNTVNVEVYLRTPLKGQKTEYDFLGMQPENCSSSLFPQYAAGRWNAPCWWLKKHNQLWQ